MLARATLRPEFKHPKSQKPQKTLNYKFTTLLACNVHFCFTHKRIHSICCKYQPHLQYMQKSECKCYVSYI